MIKKYHQSGHEGVTSAVDKLQQEVRSPPVTPCLLSMALCVGEL